MMSEKFHGDGASTATVLASWTASAALTILNTLAPERWRRRADISSEDAA